MANQPLFRTAALNAQKTKWLGTILLIRPLSYWILTLIALLCALVIVAFMLFASYTKRANVIGQLVPETGLMKVLAPQFGIVTEKKVTESQSVTKGDVLLVLSSERYASEGDSVQASISAEHTRQRLSLQEEVSKTRVQQQDEAAALQSRIAGIHDELERLETQFSAQQTRVKLSDEAYKRYQGLLAQEYVSKEQAQQKQEEWLEQSARLDTMARERVRMQRELAARKDELSSLRAKHQNQLAQIERNISSVDQQLTESEAKRKVVIRAPESGVVTAVVATPGAAIEAGRPLLSIVPKGAVLQAQLYAPSRAVGFVQVGSPVRLRYQAYPYQKFGQALGQVESVSKTALAAAEISTLGNPYGSNGQNTGEPLYRITVRLDKQSILAYGKPQQLQAGMLLDADIMLETRKLYEWVLEPLWSLTGKL